MVLMHQTSDFLFAAARQSAKSGHPTACADGRMPRRGLDQGRTIFEVKTTLCAPRIRFREVCCGAGRIGRSRSDHAHRVNCPG